MYNANVPSKEDLPSTGKLVKSTILAAIGAGILLVTVIMPAEYGRDPTGAGRLLGLTEMGEIKTALVEEAAADAKAHTPVAEADSADTALTEVIIAPEQIEQEPSRSRSRAHSHGGGSSHRH